MSTGADFRAELRRALAELHRQQRNQRGRRAKIAGIPQFSGRLGYRREPPCEHGGECRCNSAADDAVNGDSS
jgi:hypothetical protein